MPAATMDREAIPGDKATGSGARARGRAATRALLATLGTAVAFRILSDAASLFSESYGASFVFPPAAVQLACGAAFGFWGVLGVVLGALVSRWGAAATPSGLVLFAIVHLVGAAIPAIALRRPRGSTADRLKRALLLGGLAMNFATAVGGTLALAALGRLSWDAHRLADNLVSWWISDLMAALVLGFPVLLWLAPDVLLDRDMQQLFVAWKTDLAKISGSAALLIVSILVLWAAVQLGWGFPQWTAVILIGPVALAAFQGGAGAALWMVLPVSLSYFSLTILPELLAHTGPTREVLAPAYSVLVFFVSFAIVGGAFAGSNRLLLERVQRQQLQLERDFHRTVASLSAAIEAKDPTTIGHVQRVANLTVEVGRALGLSGRDLDLLRYGALLHDVGKIGVPESVLNKPGPLNPGETETMQQHVEIGLRILGNVEVLRDVLPLVRYHQERWDGQRDGVLFPGYYGLEGERIPLGARILAVVDAYDAMTNDRPYRAARGTEEALRELEGEAGRQFDPLVVATLVGLVRRHGPRFFERPSSDSGPARARAAS
ncbi:MAG: HD domain-containing protein [Thermoanaerobaculia bacterium]